MCGSKAKILEAAAPGRAVLFTLDVARLHLALPVIRACRQYGLMYHLVPAKMSWLLQPCDTRVFAAYKRHFQQASVARQLDSVGGKVGILGVMDAVFDAIRSVLQSTLWRGAFDEVGLCGDQASLFPRRLAAAGLRIGARCWSRPANGRAGACSGAKGSMSSGVCPSAVAARRRRGSSRALERGAVRGVGIRVSSIISASRSASMIGVAPKRLRMNIWLRSM